MPQEGNFALIGPLIRKAAISLILDSAWNFKEKATALNFYVGFQLITHLHEARGIMDVELSRLKRLAFEDGIKIGYSNLTAQAVLTSDLEENLLVLKKRRSTLKEQIAATWGMY